MKKYINEDLIKIIISIILIIISYLIHNETIKYILLIVSYIIISYELYIESFKNIIKLDIFDENFLMIIATIGAFYIKCYNEAVLVILLYQIGEYLSDLAVDNSKKSIEGLMNLKVEKINIIENDKVVTKKIEEAKIDDIFIVKPGEKIPLDGIVIEGESFIDTSSLTGESKPKKVKINDTILSGTINKDSVLKIKSTSTYKTSTTTKILELIENSDNEKSNTERFITKFAKIYTPIVVLLALLITFIPTILGYDFNEWLYRGLVFIVTSCPCALVISVPLGYFCGIGKASTQGILIKGSKELDKLSDIDYVILDKTGTITEGIFEVSEIKSKIDKEEFIQLAASIEENSIHPIATAIKKINKQELLNVKNYKEISGKGISCKIDNKDILLGNYKLLEDNNVEYEKQEIVGTIIYMSINNKYVGHIIISDKIKESAYNIKHLKNNINKDIIILSGDNNNIVEDVSKKIEINKYYGELLPLDKVEHVNNYKKKGKVMFVGDGINDAPVLRIADIGISMGNLGSDAAIEASDIVLMTDNLEKINTSIEISKYTKRKVKQSITFALTVKIIVLLLGLFGISSVLMAVLADVGVTLLVVLYVSTIFYHKYN